jgi:hypothetical protein
MGVEPHIVAEPPPAWPALEVRRLRSGPSAEEVVSVTSRSGRTVPLARRLLGAHPLRIVAGADGIGLTLMLILLLVEPSAAE